MSDDHSASHGADSALDLVQADVSDLVGGAELFVRGRRARCIRLDFPHVYWRFDDEQAARDADKATNPALAEKHRAFTDVPHIFQVRERQAQQQGQHTQQHQHHHSDSDTEHQGDDSSDDEDEEVQRAAAERIRLQQQQQQQEQQPSSSAEDEQQQQQQSPPQPAPSSESDSAGDEDASVSGIRHSMLNMFARLPPKVLHADVVDAESVQVLTGGMSQSLQLERCARSRFRVDSKVAGITLLNCSDVEVEFGALVSSLSLIHCQRCTLRCRERCATYQLDDARDCLIEFPAHQRQVMVVSTDSAGSELRAVPAPPPTVEDGEQPPRDIEQEVRCVIEEREEEAPAAEQAALEQGGDAAAIPPSASAKRQWMTEWSNADGAFRTSMMVRQGMQGYWN